MNIAEVYERYAQVLAPGRGYSRSIVIVKSMLFISKISSAISISTSDGIIFLAGFVVLAGGLLADLRENRNSKLETRNWKIETGKSKREIGSRERLSEGRAGWGSVECGDGWD